MWLKYNFIIAKDIIFLKFSKENKTAKELTLKLIKGKLHAVIHLEMCPAHAVE